MDVTISILPASLALVHIPRSRLPHLSHPILRQILQPNPSFLNLTCNEIELSLFAEHHMLDDFEPIARRDRQRQRSRSGSGSGRKHSTSSSATDPIEISYERWSVLQIDSHSDGLDDAGTRVHELSAPLAAAGISILYQSSYTSDFIFVKESRLQETTNLLESAGFGVYSHDPNVLTSPVSVPISPISHRSSSPGIPSQLDMLSLRDDGASENFRSAITQGLGVAQLESEIKSEIPKNADETVPIHKSSMASRKNSRSPSSGEVHVLTPDLACVGLSDDHVDRWALKIIKLVAFPELIEYVGDTTTAVKNALPLRHSAINYDQSYPAVPRGRPSFSSSVSTSSISSDDGYFSHSPTGNNSSSSLVTSAPSRSCTDLPAPMSRTTSCKSPSKHRLPPSATLRELGEVHDDAATHTPRAHSQAAKTVPFFSFTRTAEGSSLTTDVSLLAALFPPYERYMVSCSGELDAADGRDASTVHLVTEDDGEGDDCGPSSTLRCLQIDLRQFGLDKHGLVNRFSRVLNENGINHMYSSTFKTANLLVDKRHAVRAQALLRTC